MKRWMAVAALGLAAVSGIAVPGTARASSPAWYQVYQSGFPGGFNSIAALSSSNIWAVGDTYTAKGQQVYDPFIRHFNGSSWQAITIPNSSGSSSDWVSASAASNVWVSGLKNSPDAASVVYRWNGAHWGKVPVPALTDLQSLTVLAPNNVWAFGTSGTVPFDIFHWNGTRWQYYLSNGLNFIPQKLSASAPNNVWVSGFAYSGSKQVVAAYHWNGSAWQAVSMPHPAIDGGGPSVTAVSPSNVWIGWQDAVHQYALHWDGHAWHNLTAAYYGDNFDIAPDGKGGYWFGAAAILTGSTWTSVVIPAFTGGYSFLARIPGTTSFLLPASVEAGSATTEHPTIFRFDL